MAIKSRRIKPPASRKSSAWIDELVVDYGRENGDNYDVGGASDEWVLIAISEAELSIEFSVKSTGTNQDKPYLDIPDRRLLNNLITELFMISTLSISDLTQNKYFADIWNVLHKTADPLNRVGRSQSWQAFLQGLVQDKIKYKRRNYNGKWQKYTNDLSLDQVLNLHELFKLLESNSDFKPVDFVEGF